MVVRTFVYCTMFSSLKIIVEEINFSSSVENLDSFFFHIDDIVLIFVKVNYDTKVNQSLSFEIDTI